MTYIATDELKKGNINFLHSLYNYDNDIKHLIQIIRKSKDIDEILANSLYKLKNTYPRFLYKIIYDNSKYERTAYRIFKDQFVLSEFTIDELLNLYCKTTYGKIVINYFYKDILPKGDDYINALISMLFMHEDKNYNTLKELSLYEDLHIRSLFMRYLIKYYPNSISKYYDDITKYLTSYTDQVGEQMTFCPLLMDDKDICKLCVDMLDHNSPYYIKTKEFIMKNYPKNSLGGEIIRVNNNVRIEEFQKDADLFYKTSRYDKLYLYRNYSKYITKELLEQLSFYLKYFNSDSYRSLDVIYRNGLGEHLEKLVDKYISLSKSSEYGYLSSGSTTSAYRIGDYCFKLSETKWSFEDEICPNLYLILKNLEEIYLRDECNFIKAAIEVQPFLTKAANNIPGYVYTEWYKELDRFGYVYKDKLIYGCKGENGMLLDNYMDACTHNHEALPDWFKEYPLVLIDRDMIYHKNKEYKQRISASY